MRRIYDSDALARDDDEPLTPRERRRQHEPQMFRSINSGSWSDRLLPHSLRRRSITVEITTPDETFQPGDDIPFLVKMRNKLPMPVTLKTDSPLLWNWSVDGLQNASHVEDLDPPDKSGSFGFDRGERKRFRKTWSGMFRVEDRLWEPAEPGSYTIKAAINIDNPTAAGLVDETTVRIER